MISENEFVINRKKTFKNSKYIIVARLEKAGTSDSQSIENKVDQLKSYF